MIGVLFVGMQPGRAPTSRSTSLKRLDSWADALEVEAFSFVNCAHDPDSLEVDWEFLREACSYHERVVALGGFASGCLKKLGINHFRMPHPSGRNRLLNDREYEKRMIKECQAYLE